ncbi:MAG TPA: hypothetical protein VHC97_04190 [Thermoanaerobaculia bacterium]|jgi:hypothetical protein|nr:hypothetical protein [Thermoanaerobaculia bacterium]
MDLTDTDREMLRLVREGMVMRSTTPLGEGSYERADGGDLDWDALDRLAGLDLIAWPSTGVGTSSREPVELTADGREAAREL